MSKTKKTNRPIGVPVALKLLADLLLGGIILVSFAAIHHGGSWILAQIDPDRFGGETIEASSAVSHTAPAAVKEEPLPAAEESETEAEPAEELEVEDNRTEWQKKFADKFTDEVIITDHSYTSPNVFVNIETKTYGEGAHSTVYYVADVYISSIDCYRTYLANEKYGEKQRESMLDMTIKSGSILATSGDFYCYNARVVVRNGVWYKDIIRGTDICVLYGDGTMKTYRKGEYDLEELKQQDVWQIWNFGPELLTENQEVPTQFNSTTKVLAANPRSAIGYYEPGHYCFVVADGRDKNVSYGVTMSELAEIFKELGCTQAYNLDGGGSAVMAFNGALYSKMSSPTRKLADILLIAEPVVSEPEEEPVEELPAEAENEEGGTAQ